MYLNSSDNDMFENEIHKEEKHLALKHWRWWKSEDTKLWDQSFIQKLQQGEERNWKREILKDDSKTRTWEY